MVSIAHDYVVCLFGIIYQSYWFTRKSICFIHDGYLFFSFNESCLRLYEELIIDTGATKHICCNANLFISMRPIWNSMVTLSNNEQIPVTLCGDIKLSSKLLLWNVQFVPQFQFNMISISALTTDCKLIVHFFPKYFIIQDLNTMMMISKGEKCDALYVLDTSDFLYQSLSGSKPILSAQVNNVSAWIWHKRLGNLSLQILEFLNSQLHCTTKHDNYVPCCICPLAK